MNRTSLFITCAFLIAASPSVSLAQSAASAGGQTQPPPARPEAVPIAPTPQAPTQPARRGAVPVTATPQTQPPPQPARRGAVPIATTPGNDDRRGPQGFSVVLVLGSMQGATQDDVPAAARRALADMKDFLPYKSYKLLDAQWSLCCGNTPAVSRLRGVDDFEYELHLSASVFGTSVSVRFNLTEPGTAHTVVESDAGTQARLAALEQQLAALRLQRQALADKYAENHPEVRNNEAKSEAVVRDIEMTRQRAAGGRGTGFGRGVGTGVSSAGRFGSSVMDASFRMDVGETVVVGTSRLKGGDKALIALLTAVPQKGTGER